MSEESPEQGIVVGLEWHVPEDIKPRYANNLLVQHTEHDFIISFFEVYPPVPRPSDIGSQSQAPTLVRAECVGRFVIAASLMPNFVKTMQTNLTRYAAKHRQEETSEEVSEEPK